MVGWIKLHRSLRGWQWYDDHNATRLLIHLLISVNREDKMWKGVFIKAGSMITSWEHLSKDVGISVRASRIAMDKLVSSKEVTRNVTNRFQLITLVKWEELQSNDKLVTSQTSHKRQADDNLTTTTKEYKEIEEDKNKEKKTLFNFRKELLDYGFDKNLVEDWLIVRKKKKSSNTKTAFNGFIKQVEISGLNINEVLNECVNRSWSGFKYSWVEKEKNSGQKEKTINRQTQAVMESNLKGWDIE